MNTKFEEAMEENIKFTSPPWPADYDCVILKENEVLNPTFVINMINLFPTCEFLIVLNKIQSYIQN